MNITREFNLGYMTEKGKDCIVKALDKKTYMNFDVQWGIGPGGYDVTLQTDYQATDAEILTFAMSFLAEEVK